MAIEFKHNGKVWRADTPEEARELRRQLELEDQMIYEAGGEPETADEQVWTPDAVTELINGIGDQQKAFIHCLYDASPASVTSADILKKMSLRSEESFAGVLSGLSKQLKKMELKPWHLYAVNVTWSGKEKTRKFRLEHNFKWAAREIGWPDNWF